MNLIRHRARPSGTATNQRARTGWAAPNRRGSARAIALLLLWGAGVFFAACVPDLSHPPRLQTETAPVPTGQATLAPIRLPAPTATGEPYRGDGDETAVFAAHPTVTLWVNKTSAQYERALQAMIEAFTAEHNVHVELVTIAPDLLPDMVESAAMSETIAMPDVIILPGEFVAGWVQDGILDPQAAESVVQELDPATFDPEALELATVDGRVSAVPSDGWQQLLIYRSDWFAERDLPPPADFETMLSAAEVISDRVNLIYSFNMPTESSLRATTRTFEQMAIANGCQIIDGRGELQILRPQCRDAFEFYRYICNTYCPPGVQTEVSTLNAYLEGRAGMIMASPGALAAIAGLDETYQPSCERCDTPTYLAENTGIVTTITGRHADASPQNFGALSYLGITSKADMDATMAFTRFWFNEGYLKWLAVEPEHKVPLRRGTLEEPARFVDAWYDLPFSSDGRTLSDVYGSEIATALAEGVVNNNRWGHQQNQEALITNIYEELTFSILLQELLSGYYNSERAAIEGYKRLVDLIPDYPYYVDPEPTPTPEA